MKKLISFWKQVKEKSSDMFTLFRVGIGVKVPTHKLHVKDASDPVKLEGVQNDTTDPDKFLSLDSNNIVKYRTGSEVLSDIGGISATLTQEQVEDYVAGLITAGTNVTAVYDDGAGTLTISSTDTNTQLTQEQVEDYVNGLVVAGSNMTITYDDGAGTLTFAATDTNTTYTGSSGVRLTGTDFSLDTTHDARFNSVESSTFKATGDLDLIMDSDSSSSGNYIKFKADAGTEVGSISDKGDMQIDGILTGKVRHAYNQSFFDDMGTTKHYIPFSTQNEQTTVYQEEAAMVMPCDGRVVSVTFRASTITGTGTLTLGVHTIPPNSLQTSSGNWTEQETEALTVSSTDDYHVFHFAFGNAKHFDAGEMLSISIQASSDLSGSTYWYVTTVVEYDWNNYLGTTSAEYDTAQ